MLQDLWKERQGRMAAIAELEASDDSIDNDDKMNDLVRRLYDGPERTISQTVPENLTSA
jgi:hypothetical protein